MTPRKAAASDAPSQADGLLRASGPLKVYIASCPRTEAEGPPPYSYPEQGDTMDEHNVRNGH